MQWRMLARRCPSGSMTLVGDPGQASRPGALASWDDVLAHLPHAHHAAFVTLIGQLPHAGRGDGASRPASSPSRRRRSSRRGRCAARASTRASSRRRPTTLVAETADDVRAALSTHGHGRRDRAGRDARGDRRAALARRRRSRGRRRSARRADRGPRRRRSAKGLEFDHVVVVEPSRLVTADRPASACSTSRSPARRRRSRSCTPSSLPEGLAPSRVDAAS